MTTPTALLTEITAVGADRNRGGYSRHVFDRSEHELREWFVAQAQQRDLQVTTDRNANLWAWWGEPGPDAVVTGSHLDSVPGGGAFDGPLGVVCSLTALDQLRAEGFVPRRPLAVSVFAEEEGSRFGVPCLGSRLMTGAMDPDAARNLRDPDGVTFADAMRRFGLTPDHVGRDDEAVRRIGHFVELHVEQGRGLIDLGEPIAIASSILAHGRWRFRFSGQGNHAGATLIDDRRDPMLPAAELVSATRRAARARDDARATIGRLEPTPGGTNVIASTVDVWLDARSERGADVRGIVEELTTTAHELAEQEGCQVQVSEESYTPTVSFESGVRDDLAGLLRAPLLPTGAGHDAGVLAGSVPTAMLFVRNPTGISHAPDEFAEADDCTEGSRALARTLRHLAS